MKNACGAARHFFPSIFLLLNDVLRRHEERVDVLEAVELCLVDTVDDAPGGKRKNAKSNLQYLSVEYPTKAKKKKKEKEKEKKTDWTKSS